ncbi:hypothetical protein LINPERHAP2_LOCUS33060 [Linum perenne]
MPPSIHVRRRRSASAAFNPRPSRRRHHRRWSAAAAAAEPPPPLSRLFVPPEIQKKNEGLAIEYDDWEAATLKRV